MKKIFTLLLLIISSFSFAQTTLSAGEIVITGFNSDAPDQFTFVLLIDVVNTTTINFTDNGWFAASGFRDNEGTVTWTATSDLICGTEVIIETIGANLFSASIGTAVSTNNGFGLAVSGDQILAYQGPDATPTFLYAVDFNSTGWTDATSANDTALPTGLTDAVDAVDLGETDSGIYDCSVLNDPTLVLAAVSDNTNWTLNNTPLTLGGCYYTCCVATTSWNGTIWDNGDPDNTKQAILNADYSTATDLPGSFEACSLLVNPGIAGNDNLLSILGTDDVTIINDIVLENFTKITIATEASLVQVNDNANVTLNGTGIGELQKTTTIIDDWFDYTYWSSAFTNETIGSALTGVPANRIFKYEAANYEDTDNNGFDDNANDWIIAPQAEVMAPGKGYAAIADALAPIPGTHTYTFDGQFNNGVIIPTVSVSPGPNPVNWNFLGNPYPSPIDADLFLGDVLNTGLNGTLYLWTHNSDPSIINPGNETQNFSVDDYASYNATGGTAAVSGGATPTGIIATGQGFFIEANTGGVATFNNSMRVNSGNDNFYRTADRIWLDFKNVHGAFSQILIGFNENATNGVDRLYDGKRLDVGAYVSFYSLIEDVEEKFAIQSRAPITGEEMIPLGIMSTIEGENEFSIAISQVEGLLETSDVYLLDNLLNVEHNLSETDYTFTTDNGEFKDRFVLTLRTDLNPIDYSVEDELIVVKNENGHIDFTTRHQTEIQNIQVFDVLGRQLYNIDFNNQTTLASLKLENLNNTIFIAKATLVNGKTLTKKGVMY